MRVEATPHSAESSPHPISILVVDESAPRLELLIAALRAAGYDRLYPLQNSTELHQVVRETRPDVVLIEVDSQSIKKMEQLKLIRDHAPTPVLMVAQDPQAQTIQEAVASGVCAYSVGDVSTDRVKPAIEVAMATFASFKALRDQLSEARRKLSQQKRIDRAKCILIQQKGLSEEQAHKTLRKLAMDRKRKLVDIADDLIAMSKLLS